jgi:pimeloyl-ACP methyl ester carboxylesterase
MLCKRHLLMTALLFGMACISQAIVYADSLDPSDLAVSGLWFDPSRDGEGFNVIQSDAGITVFFYGYDTEGEQLWLITDTSTELIEPGKSLSLAAYRGFGGSFDIPTPPEALEYWGMITLEPENCDTAVFELVGTDGTKVSDSILLAGIDGHICSLPEDSARGTRYCEILLFYPAEGGLLEAEVWGTQFIGDCPAEQWDALDATTIQADYGASFVKLNGPRNSLPDFGGFDSTGDVIRSYGGIDMAQHATLLVDPTQTQGPYEERTALRVNRFEQWAGSEVYEITSSDDTQYVMISASQIVDPALTVDQLPGLGARLSLPEGWSWSVRTLETSRALETEGKAVVLQDEFENTYQRISETKQFGLAGLWFDPLRDGEGFNIVQSDAGTTVFFYGYDDNSEALWLISETLAAPIGAGDARVLAVYRGQGGTFENPIPGADLDYWGTLIIVAEGCDHARFELEGTDGSKRAELVKLAGIGGNSCIEPEVLVTADGVEFVRSPDVAFDDLPDWPYEAKYVEIDGLRQAYIDVGPATGPVVLLLHGQPSWSYLYRKMIPVLRDAGYRVIAMDHLGTGRSDKPIHIEAYSYLGHADRLERFIEVLGLHEINLFVQDWGSLIGLRVAGLNPDWFASIAVGNGILPVLPAGIEVFPPVEEPQEVLDIESPYASFPDQQVPFYNGCELLLPRQDDSYFGIWMEYAMKGISFRASDTLEALTWFDLPIAEEAAYDAPFPSRLYMAGIRVFPSLVNELPGANAEAEAGLLAFDRPFLTLWGSNDAGAQGSCESQQYFIDNVPGAAGQPHDRLAEAGHFLQDDQGEEIALRLVDFYVSNGIGDAPAEPDTEEIQGFEIFQVLSDGQMLVWLSSDITQSEFEALDLPDGWRKNQSRESDPDRGTFTRSPDAAEDGPLTEGDFFGFTWRHNATVIETGIEMDNDGLLNAGLVEKFHEIVYDSGRTVFVLLSPEGDQYIRVTRDAARVSDTPTLPDGWRLVAHVTPEQLTIFLPNPTLNIRADNQDSFQGPVEISGLDDSVVGASGPLALDSTLCEDADNMDILLDSQEWQQIASSAQFNVEQIGRMVSDPTEGPFYMFNLIRFRERAQYRDGRETDLTGREANALYAPSEFIEAIGARPVFSTAVAEQIDGDDILWDDVGIVEYPCPVAFFAMLLDPDFQARAIHKDAGVEKTIVIVTDLEPSLLPPGFEPPDSPYPPSEEDPSFELIHVMDFHDIAQYEEGSGEPERTGAEAWDLYESNGSDAGAAIGSYPTARFAVQGVFQGDDRSWDEIHINHMPSLAGFEALLADETRQAGRYHRYAALAHNYSLITYPQLNEIPGAVGTDADTLPVTEDGVGTSCRTDADCEGIGWCISDGAATGFCTRACVANACGAPYSCCRSCSETVASQLPFSDSACLPQNVVDQLTQPPASCTCD